MVRLFSFVLAVGFLAGAFFAGGCARNDSKTQGAAESQGGERHLAIRPADPASETAPAADRLPVATQQAASPPIDDLPLTATEPVDPLPPENHSHSPSEPLETNPLRAEAEPLSLASTDHEAENPLRAFRSAHAFRSVPRGHRALPKMAFPVGESSPPPAAADPPSAAPELSLPETAAMETAPLAGFERRETAVPRDAPSAGDSVPRQPLAAAGLLSSPLPAPAASAYDVVQVFYATNRAEAVAPAASLPRQASRFLPTAISVLLTLSLGLVALAKRRPAIWFLVLSGLTISVALGYQAASGTLVAARRSRHVGPQYTSDRSSAAQVHLGMCEVSIPRTHQVGELEAPSILRLEIKPDAAKHVVLQKTERLADEEFYALLAERVAASPGRELFVFVHGFNVTFEDAARRTAQIHHDLRYEGVPVFFSWPANDKFILTYKADEANVSWSAAHLKQFLLDVTKRSNARSINLIAHSMGNRALTVALKELQLELASESRLFNQVILAAPDIDADEFRQSIAPAMTRTANRITLYASGRDEALAASQLVHRGPRAGDAGRGLVLVAGIDTIDVTPIDTSPWGHTYYGSSDPVLRDLGLLLTQAAPPSERLWLSPAQLDGQPYWVFQPQSATARVPGSDPR